MVFPEWRAPLSKNTSVSLGDHVADVITAPVAAGRYGNASEVVRDALRLLEERETRLAAQRAALIEGEEGGDYQKFDFDAFLAEMHKGSSTTA